MYVSSECYFGVNLKPLCDPADVAFTLLPNMGYFEFLPLGDNGKFAVMELDEEEDQVPKDKLVDLVDVRLGCYYELVVTTFAGHYVIFWEIKAPFATTPDTDYATVLQECCVAVEEELDYIYRRCRAHDKSVGVRWRYTWSSRARFMG
ncbi:hypothetical protein RHMOL_Rhmol10G0036900 [Rhododendron molle]|uniref:Uncharacterized protein n=1 Tax=Rhododendron molle TaxID=49168 RepID=A0ACC0LZT1_RHOML|nr:hypothetical protein RHMOL_Rhmol10G0036900 [Rhododendron molle]